MFWASKIKHLSFHFDKKSRMLCHFYKEQRACAMWHQQEILDLFVLLLRQKLFVVNTPKRFDVFGPRWPWPSYWKETKWTSYLFIYLFLWWWLLFGRVCWCLQALVIFYPHHRRCRKDDDEWDQAEDRNKLFSCFPAMEFADRRRDTRARTNALPPREKKKVFSVML